MTDDAEFALPAEISLSRATAGLTTQLALKRAFDIVAAFVLLLLLHRSWCWLRWRCD